MRQENLVPCRPRPFRVTTQADEDEERADTRSGETRLHREPAGRDVRRLHHLQLHLAGRRASGSPDRLLLEKSRRLIHRGSYACRAGPRRVEKRGSDHTDRASGDLSLGWSQRLHLR